MTSTYRCSSADKTLATEALRQGEKKKPFPCVAIGSSSEKEGTTKDTKSTKKSFSFPLCSSCPSWFEAFMPFATASTPVINERDYEPRAGVKWLAV